MFLLVGLTKYLIKGTQDLLLLWEMHFGSILALQLVNSIGNIIMLGERINYEVINNNDILIVNKSFDSKVSYI